MKIGILTYHYACNYGANLQLYSTYKYLSNVGYDPIIINWVPLDLEKEYKDNSSNAQYLAHKEFVESRMAMTELCRDDIDIINEIMKHNIKSVIIGSDAVLKNVPFLARISFPSRRIIKYIKPTSDCIFPNPYWGSFWECTDVKVILMSASSQNTEYAKIFSTQRIKMMAALEKFDLITVRDAWTKKMIEYITRNKIKPEITPDPVFGFNYNVKEHLCKEDILKKYDLKDNYILISFINTKLYKHRMFNDLLNETQKRKWQLVILPFPNSPVLPKSCKAVNLPLDPLDWYWLIKYSAGYIGQNMHPIIICLHNKIPFYTFDHYGVTYAKVIKRSSSSKIFHILEKGGFLRNRYSMNYVFNKYPSAIHIINCLQNMNMEKLNDFAECQLIEYQHMMNKIRAILDKQKY